MTRDAAGRVSQLLAPGSAGGTIMLDAAIGRQDLRILVASLRGRVAELRSPSTKQELLAQLKHGLALPDWFGENWDALEEALSTPQPALDGPVLIVWTGSQRLEAHDAAAAQTFRAIVGAAAASRAQSGDGPLVLVMAETEQTFDHLVTWQIGWTSGFEAAWVSIGDSSVTARVQVAAWRPEPYTALYSLDATDGHGTRALTVHVESAAGERELSVRREGGTWVVNGTVRDDLEGAVDCDIQASPLTNTMPILRHALHRRPGQVTLAMAFVELPTLQVLRSEQTYTHLHRLERGGAVVRYQSSGFEADLVVGDDGIVVEYPILGARRIMPDD